MWRPCLQSELGHARQLIGSVPWAALLMLILKNDVCLWVFGDPETNLDSNLRWNNSVLSLSVKLSR